MVTLHHLTLSLSIFFLIQRYEFLWLEIQYNIEYWDMDIVYWALWMTLFPVTACQWWLMNLLWFIMCSSSYFVLPWLEYVFSLFSPVLPYLWLFMQVINCLYHLSECFIPLPSRSQYLHDDERKVLQKLTVNVFVIFF